MLDKVDGHLVCVDGVDTGEQEGESAFLKQMKIPSPMKIDRLLLENEGMHALFKMPFFKNVTTKQWQEKVKENGSPLKPMTNITNGFKTAPSQNLRQWALNSIENANSAQAQLIYQEWHSLNRGYLQSPSIDDYEKLKKQEKRHSTRKKNEFMLALQFGLDLVLPKAVAQDDNEEVLTVSPIASPTPTLFGTPISSENGNTEALDEEELEAEENFRADINSVGEFGPSRAVKFLGFGAALGGVALSMVGGTSKFVDNWVGKPFNRGILFQATAILTIVNKGIVSRNLETMKENRDYVRDLLNRLEDEEGVAVTGSSTDSITGSSSSDTGGIVRDPSLSGLNLSTSSSVQRQEQQELADLINNELGIPCVDGRDSNGNCTDPQLAERVQEENTDLGGLAANFTGPLGTLSRLTQTASRGQVAASNELLTTLGNNRTAKAVETGLRAIQREVNQELFDNGEEIIDFKGQSEGVARSLENIVRNEARRIPGGLAAIGNQGPAARNLQASLSPVKRTATDASRKKGNGLKFSAPKKSFSSKSRKSRKSSNKYNLFGSRNKKNVSAKKALEDRAVEHQDISKNKEVSIFKILSSRYKRSAVPQFFNRKRKAAGKSKK